MRLEVDQDNGARWHWTLIAESGKPLARSLEGFGSQDAATRDANDLREQVAAAPIEVG